MSTRPTPIPREYVPIVASAAVILIAVVVIGVSQLAGRPRALQITPIPSPSTVSTPVRLSAPLSAPTGTPVIAPVRTIDAYAAPDGVVLGPVEMGRIHLPVARYGDEWMQAEVEGSGRVWLRAADVPDYDVSGLPDLTPPTPAPRADFAPVQNWQPPAVQQVEPPAEPTAPPEVAPTVMWIPTATPAGWNGGGGSGW